MSSIRFRASKYRHTVGTLYKKEQWYPDLRPSVSSSDAQCIAASATNLAYVQENGTSVAVIPQENFGKRAGEPGKIHAHSAQIYDIQYSPHNDNILATVGDDCILKLWNTPQGFTGDISDTAASLQGHKKRVGVVRFHPTASNVVATGSHDAEIMIWDVDGGQQLKLEIGAIVHSVAWSFTGDLLACTSADCRTAIWDPRGKTQVQLGPGHQGVKPSRSIWLGNNNRLATTGFSGLRERQFNIWDTRDLSKPLTTTTIDASTGILEPFYDIDTSLFYLAGKGDGNIRAYEITDIKPFIFEISPFVTDLPTKSICMAPKTSLDVMNCEVVKLFKLTTNSIVPIGFNVPRKSKQEFAEDIFPPTIGRIASISGSEWFSGVDGKHVVVSLNPAHNGERQEVIVEEQVRKEQEAAAAVEVVQKELPKLNIVRSSKYRHVAGKLSQKNRFFENIKADNSSSESETLKFNTKYFAVPWSGPGGQVGVFPMDKPGRFSNTPGLIECGSAQLDLDWNPFDDDILATGLEDGRIKIWKIPEGLYLMKKNFTSELTTLRGHRSKVTLTKFHPSATNVLTSASYDLTLKLWDITQEAPQLSISEHPDIIQHLCFNYEGSIIATSCKDKKLRLVDPRSSSVVNETNGHQGSKTSKLTWLGEGDRMLSVGFSRQSEREFSIWDTRNFSSPLGTHIIDVSAGVITPFYEEGTKIVYFAGKGDATISYYEIDSEPPYAHFLSKFQTSTPQMGFYAFPQRFCDVREVELFKGMRLTTTNIEPVSFSVPRTRKEFFQDDIFPPALAGVPSMSSAEWFRGENKPPVKVSLKPADMVNLSEAPAIKREIKYNFEDEVAKRGTGTVTKEQVMGKFYQQITNNWKEEGNQKKNEDTDLVDEDEWDD